MGSRNGVLKVAARRVGLSVSEYMDRIANGMKWCTLCAEWKSVDDFDFDATRGDARKSSCRRCGRALWRRRKMNRGPTRIERRSGDKVQAVARINADVRMGLRPNPNELHCAICGHKGKDRRHEYHHHLGYEPDHHYDVIALCSKCHHAEHQNG